MNFLASALAVVATATAALAEEAHIQHLRGDSISTNNGIIAVDGAVSNGSKSIKADLAHAIEDTDIKNAVALRGRDGKGENKGNGHAYAHGHGKGNGEDTDEPELPSDNGGITCTKGLSVNCPKPSLINGGKADIVIIGAGAAGLSAAARIRQAKPQWDVVVLEADPKTFDQGHAGRVRLGNYAGQDKFSGASFDIGGEWIHTEPATISGEADQFWQYPKTMLREMLKGISTKTLELKLDNYPKMKEDWGGSERLVDYRWLDFTWWDFFNEYIFVPNELGKVVKYGRIVKKVQYSQNAFDDQNTYAASVTYQYNGQYYQIRASQVIVTTSMEVIDDITFQPPLPSTMTNAINQYTMGIGVKVFMEFENKFWENGAAMYVDFVNGKKCYSTTQGDGYYFFDEGFGHSNANMKVLGFFSQGDCAKELVKDKSNTQIVEALFKGMNAKFDTDKANWNNEKNYYIIDWGKQNWVETGYTQNTKAEHIATMKQTVGDGQLFFAGEALPVSGQPGHCGFIHGASFSGKAAANEAINYWKVF